MSSKVYSAARAFFPLDGMSKEQAWKVITGMFNKDARNARMYFPGYPPLQCIERQRQYDISVRDRFRYETVQGTKYYIQVVECTPYKSFTYDEAWMPKSGIYMDEAYKDDNRDRMEFILRSHPEATLVEIRLRVKEAISWDDKINRDPVGRAARRLQYILTEGHWNKDEITRGEITIKRDDSYRIDF